MPTTHLNLTLNLGNEEYYLSPFWKDEEAEVYRGMVTCRATSLLISTSLKVEEATLAPRVSRAKCYSIYHLLWISAVHALH